MVPASDTVSTDVFNNLADQFDSIRDELLLQDTSGSDGSIALVLLIILLVVVIVTEEQDGDQAATAPWFKRQQGQSNTKEKEPDSIYGGR